MPEEKTLLDDVKVALRVTNSHFDNEIQDLIDASKLDLSIAGIFYEYPNKESDIDSLIKRAIITYCKANFGYDNPEADRFYDSYVMLKQHLSLSGDYHAP